MMTKLREMTFIFIWILVIAFVGLMVFEWGMDFTGIRSRSNIVGEINGTKITIQQFQEAVQATYLQERESSGTEPDENRMNQIRDQVWDQFIQRVLFSEEIEKRHIMVSDTEVVLQITQNPQSLPPAISQNPNFMTDGRFDMTKYRQVLNNPEVDWRPIEDYVREVLPFQKLQAIILSSVMVTEKEIRDEYLDKNQQAKINYLFVPASAFIKDSVKVEESEVKKYYESNKEEFKLEERRKLNSVVFSTNPSAADTQKVLALASQILAEAQAGEDFSRLADEYSEDPSARNNHGDLGYFEQGRMVKEFSDAAFAAKPGEIVGPVRTNFGVHIIKVHDRKIEEGQEKVHASHILLKFTASAITLETAQNLANNFAEMAQEDGFKLSADQLKYEIQQTPEFMNRNYIPGFGQMNSAVEWTFRSKLNSVSRVYRATQGFVVFQVAEIFPSGYRPLEEVRELCKNRVELQKRNELARVAAMNIQEKINQNRSFQAITEEYEAGMVLADSTTQFTRSQTIPKIGRSAEITAAAFTLPVGTVSGMLTHDRGFYFIQVVERSALDEDDYDLQRENIRMRLLNQKSQRFFEEWYENLKQNAKIKDYRELFFML